MQYGPEWRSAKGMEDMLAFVYLEQQAASNQGPLCNGAFAAFSNMGDIKTRNSMLTSIQESEQRSQTQISQTKSKRDSSANVNSPVAVTLRSKMMQPRRSSFS